MKSKPIHGTRGSTGRGRKPALKVSVGVDSENARAQRRALRNISELELATGRSPEWWEAHHAEQRARVLKRYGVRP